MHTFRKIGKKHGRMQYLFFPWNIYASKAYVVNSTEKKEISTLKDSYLFDITTGFSCFSTFLSGGKRRHKAHWFKSHSNKSHTVLYIFLGVLFGFLFIKYIKYKRQLKKILGDRKKIPCERLLFIKHQKEIAKKEIQKSIKEGVETKLLLQYMFLVLMNSILIYSLFLEYKKTGSILCVLADVFFVFITALLFIFTITHAYLNIQNKIKNSLKRVRLRSG